MKDRGTDSHEPIFKNDNIKIIFEEKSLSGIDFHQYYCTITLGFDNFVHLLLVN